MYTWYSASLQQCRFGHLLSTPGFLYHQMWYFLNYVLLWVILRVIFLSLNMLMNQKKMTYDETHHPRYQQRRHINRPQWKDTGAKEMSTHPMLIASSSTCSVFPIICEKFVQNQDRWWQGLKHTCRQHSYHYSVEPKGRKNTVVSQQIKHWVLVQWNISKL